MASVSVTVTITRGGQRLEALRYMDVEACPFCGAVPEVRRDSAEEDGEETWHEWYLTHYCAFFRARLRSKGHETAEGAVDLWNDRAVRGGE